MDDTNEAIVIIVLIGIRIITQATILLFRTNYVFLMLVYFDDVFPLSVIGLVYVKGSWKHD